MCNNPPRPWASGRVDASYDLRSTYDLSDLFDPLPYPSRWGRTRPLIYWPKRLTRKTVSKFRGQIWDPKPKFGVVGRIRLQYL